MATDPYTDGSGPGWPVPVLSAGMTFRDVGSSGLRQFGGWIREEFLPALQGRQAARVYREMLDNSSTVGSVIFAITQAMRKVEWRTEPANDTPEAQEMADFADSLRFDMSHTWDDFVAEALSMLGYGYSAHEIIYKRRNGRKPERSNQPSSLFDDGRIGVRKLPMRGQDTILKWFLGDNGDVLGLTQQPWVGQLIDIPIEKLLLFRPVMYKGNPEGRSVLRNSYRPYFFIKRIEEQEAILFERMAGLPCIYVPNALLEAAAAGNQEAVTAVAAYKKLVTNVRIDEQMGVMLPSDLWQNANGPTTQKMYEFELITPKGGATGIDSEKMIERYKLEILMTALCDFIQLGHAARGTQNLALSKVDMFFQAIEGWLNSIAAVLNRFLLPRVWALNGFDLDLMPQYVPDLAQRIDLDALGNYVMHLAQAGMQMFPDADLENYLRDAAGMPDVSDEGVYAEVGGDPASEGNDQALDASAPDPGVLKRAAIRRALLRRAGKVGIPA